MNFPAQLVELRKQQGFSQQRLADAVDDRHPIHPPQVTSSARRALA
jgi:hypothetical protein